MARGWESKSVESQQNDAPLVKEKQVDRQRHSLEMSRRRIVAELAATQSDVRRSSLEAALRHLDEELAKLP
jgi:ribosomal protein S25